MSRDSSVTEVGECGVNDLISIFGIGKGFSPRQRF
jgi:hypothetical protein